MTKTTAPWRLGLDIGSSSVGWAALELASKNGQPSGILGLGARVFDAGADGDIESGKDESRSTKRRGARLQRRQGERRVRRMRNLFNELRRAGLLPGVGAADPTVMHETIRSLDTQLRPLFVAEGDHRQHQLLPYLIRSAAAERKLDPHAVGRALLHLAQRRGFQSNRKESSKQTDEKELGPVKEGIATLAAIMGTKTLGQHFASLDPELHRIRNRWTSRDMYKAEFDQIRETQKDFLTHLDDQAWGRIRDRIFKQRPLKSQKGKVGRCEFIRADRRAPIWLPEFQRFRLLATVNHLRVRTAEKEDAAITVANRRGFTDRPLTADERTAAIRMLEQRADVKLTSLRKQLKLSGTTFSIEEGGEKQLKGDTTSARMRGVFGDRWDTMSANDQSRAITDVLSIEQDATMARRGCEVWALSTEDAQAFVKVRFEEGYASLGRRAIARLLPHLESGLSIQEARKLAFPNHFVASECKGTLAPVRKSLYHLRNPTVERSLTEVRRIVNELIRMHGVPEQIHIELARDIKRSKKDRQQMTKENRSRQAERERAAERIKAYVGNPSRSDIEKVLLHDECGGCCPYTGQSIPLENLFSGSSEWDVEHIIPFSRSLDDSFANKTLCNSDENRSRKGNRTPFEAYGGDPARYNEILARVGKFQGELVRVKLTRFRLQMVGSELCDEFCSRQLNDTRYAARLAQHYVETLYGGLSDASGIRRVFASSGQATAIVRRELGIVGLLHPTGSDIKNRDDHRHHATDAIAIALTSPAMVKRLADAAEGAWAAKRRRFLPIEAPWPRFVDEVDAKLREMVVSHRGSRVLSGELHEATNYSAPIGGDPKHRHVRKPMSAFAKGGDINDIVDDAVREAVQNHLNKHGGNKKVFAIAEDPPRMLMKNGTSVAIRRVRIRASRGTVVPVGNDRRRRRYVAPGANHHMVIVAVIGADGKPNRWEGHVVTRLEAVRRSANKLPVIQRDWGTDRKFCFTLASGDMVRLTIDGEGTVWLVRGVTGSRLDLTPDREGRPVTVLRQLRVSWKPTVNTAMMQHEMQRLEVSACGVVRICNA